MYIMITDNNDIMMIMLILQAVGLERVWSTGQCGLLALSGVVWFHVLEQELFSQIGRLKDGVCYNLCNMIY